MDGSTLKKRPEERARGERGGRGGGRREKEPSFGVCADVKRNMAGNDVWRLKKTGQNSIKPYKINSCIRTIKTC